MSLLDLNYYQVELIKESELDAMDWIEVYSAKFRELVEGGVTSFDDLKTLLYKN